MIKSYIIQALEADVYYNGEHLEHEPCTFSQYLDDAVLFDSIEEAEEVLVATIKVAYMCVILTVYMEG